MAPRYSIIPGDFATDARADVGHFRVLNLIGRHTDQSGWCRLKQFGIGLEVGLSRKTVNEKIRDLVAWGYVEKTDEDGSGRAIWYRTIMDRPVPPPRVAPEPDERESDCDGEGDGPVTGALQVPVTTCNAQEVTPGVTTGRYTERPLLNDLPPKSPASGGLQSKHDWKGAALAVLRGAGKHVAVVEHLIAPLLASDKRLSLGPDPRAALAEIAEAGAGLAPSSLSAAAKRLIESPSKITVAAVRKQLDVARSSGAMVVIRRGSAQWQRWAEHCRAVEGRKTATMEKFDVWQVPTEWPPAATASKFATTGRASA